MTDDFQPGADFRRRVDQRARELHRRRWLVAVTAAGAAIVLAVALPLVLVSGGESTIVKTIAPGSTVPSATATTSTAPRSTTVPRSATPASTSPASTVPRSATPASATPASTITPGTVPASTIPASTITPSNEPASTTPASTSKASTTAGGRCTSSHLSVSVGQTRARLEPITSL